MSSRDIITRENEAKALCTDEFSDISPLTGGSVAFSTLEGRPSAFEFEESAVLQVIRFHFVTILTYLYNVHFMLLFYCITFT